MTMTATAMKKKRLSLSPFFSLSFTHPRARHFLLFRVIQMIRARARAAYFTSREVMAWRFSSFFTILASLFHSPYLYIYIYGHAHAHLIAYQRNAF